MASLPDITWGHRKSTGSTNPDLNGRDYWLREDPANFKLNSSLLIYVPAAVSNDPGINPESDFSIFPNPINHNDGQLSAELKNQYEGDFTVTITDLTGHVLYERSIGKYPEGKHNVILLLPELSDGIYLINCKSEKENFIKKISVQKWN